MDTIPDLDIDVVEGEGSERMTQAANLAGVEQVDHVTLQLSALRKRVILVRVTVTGSSLFTQGASYAELGIADKDARKNRYTPGQKFIFPREVANKWRSVENRLRDALDRLSYDIDAFAPYRALPWKAIKKWRKIFDKLQSEAAAIREQVKAEYPEYITRLTTELREGAASAWRAVMAQGYDAVRFGGREFFFEEDFINAVVERAITHVPSLEEVDRKLRIHYSAALVYGQADVAADRKRAAEIEEQEAVLREQYRARQREQHLQADILQDQFSHQRRMHELKEMETEAKAEAAIRAELEHAREQMKEQNSYINAIFQGLRERIAKDAEELLQSIQKNGFVRGKIAEKGAGLLELYELLAVHDDRALLVRLQTLKDKIGPIGDARGKDTVKRDAASVAHALQSIIDLAEGELEDLDVSRASFLEL